jgi:murein DD-endopeptidase MepM/ murein hydrolase activator NlpD
VYVGLDSQAERWSLFEHLSPRSHESSGEAHDRAERLGLGSRSAASALLTGVVAPEWIDEANLGGDVGDGQLRWPVQNGYFGRGYGSGENNYHLAVDIAGELHAAVGAAAPGIVGYVGHELRGYGNVVLVVHPGGWVTLYGHNERVVVSAGERVQQGQTIALLGSTGRSMGPHVHFELIYQGRNCDPLPFVRHADVAHISAATPTKEVAWDPWTPKPRAVRCHKRMMHPSHEDDDQTIAGNNQAGSPRG